MSVGLGIATAGLWIATAIAAASNNLGGEAFMYAALATVVIWVFGS